MRERLAPVADVCKKYLKELMRFDVFGVFSILTVAPAHHLVYCRNAKVKTQFIRSCSFPIIKQQSTFFAKNKSMMHYVNNGI